jgi:hypothetical protein
MARLLLEIATGAEREAALYWHNGRYKMQLANAMKRQIDSVRQRVWPNLNHPPTLSPKPEPTNKPMKRREAADESPAADEQAEPLSND